MGVVRPPAAEADLTDRDRSPIRPTSSNAVSGPPAAQVRDGDVQVAWLDECCRHGGPIEQSGIIGIVRGRLRPTTLRASMLWAVADSDALI